MCQTSSSQATKPVFRRIFQTFGVCTSIGWSLLAFPHYLPWMIAFWLAWYTLAVSRGKSGTLPLFVCVAVLVVRLVPRFPLLMGLVGLMLCIGIWRWRVQRKRLRAVESESDRSETTESSRWTPWLVASVLLLWGSWGLMFLEYRAAARCSQRIELDAKRPVLCIGDSLTEGMIPDSGFPGKLTFMIAVPVDNQGASGIASGPAIGILERALVKPVLNSVGESVRENRSDEEVLIPQAVVIEVGGHDFLRWHSRSATKANLEKMIVMAREHGCEPILMEIPRGFMIDPYASLERELASTYDLQLVDDRWLRHVVLMGPAAPPGRWMESRQLSDDGIHSNPQGSHAIAGFVADALAEVFGEGILLESERR